MYLYECCSIFGWIYPLSSIRIGALSRTSAFIRTPCWLSADWWYFGSMTTTSVPLALFSFCVLCGSFVKITTSRPHSDGPANMSWKGKQSPPVGPVGDGHLKVRVGLWCWSVSSLVSWYIQCLHVVFSESGLVNTNSCTSTILKKQQPGTILGLTDNIHQWATF